MAQHMLNICLECCKMHVQVFHIYSVNGQMVTQFQSSAITFVCVRLHFPWFERQNKHLTIPFFWHSEYQITWAAQQSSDFLSTEHRLLLYFRRDF